jgi:hypothetical protein
MTPAGAPGWNLMHVQGQGELLGMLVGRVAAPTRAPQPHRWRLKFAQDGATELAAGNANSVRCESRNA